MLKVWTDFNALSERGRCFILLVDGVPIDDAPAAARLKAGDRIILFQDPDDFEVEAVLGHGRPGAPAPDQDAWYAEPDWSTRVDIEGTI